MTRLCDCEASDYLPLRDLDPALYDQVKSEDAYTAILGELEKLHTLKSGGYGTGKDPYANFTAVGDLTGQPRYLYATLRAIEKLTRVLSLHEQGRTEELSEEFTDIASLLICAESMRRSDNA